MQEYKNKVEAILFTTGKFIKLEEISKLCNLEDLNQIKEFLAIIKKEYSERETPLEVIRQGDSYKLTLKKEFLSITTQLLSDTEMDRPTQETLALIAWKQPVLQSEIIHMRGNSAYEHIHVMKALDLVTADKSGRTRMLKTTPKFYDYFDIVDAQLKEKLQPTVAQEPQPAEPVHQPEIPPDHPVPEEPKKEEPNEPTTPDSEEK